MLGPSDSRSLEFSDWGASDARESWIQGIYMLHFYGLGVFYSAKASDVVQLQRLLQQTRATELRAHAKWRVSGSAWAHTAT